MAKSALVNDYEEKNREKSEKINEIQTSFKIKRKDYILIKSFADFLIALITVLVLAPILALISIIIKLDLDGQVIFKHLRYGKNKKPFYLYKFMTIVKDAHLKQNELQKINEMTGGSLFKSDKDPRITKVGKFLRKYSMDELPQFFNILKGDMSIIGPRPLSTPIYLYENYQLRRFIMKPGLGCIWQAYYRKETNFTKWIKTDLLYIRKASVLVDIKLIFKIIINVLLGKGAR